MKMDRSPRLEGQDWQRWATQLLHARYPVGEYQEVPDSDKGDAGVEGYSLDGCAYQMYGPEGELNFRERHNQLRVKITTDIKKFIDNKDKLARLFGSLRITRWVLLVPSFDSRELVEHASKKTAEVMDAGLPYVDKGYFQVIIVGENAFACERTMLLGQGVAAIAVMAPRVTDEDADEWSQNLKNQERASNLEAKVAKLPTLTSDVRRSMFQKEVIKWWLDGQNVLEGLREYPDAWESIRRTKSEQEKYLKGDCMITNEQPYNILNGALQKIDAAVKREVRALADDSRLAIAHEAVAEWLMRCPLDFPEMRIDE